MTWQQARPRDVLRRRAEARPSRAQEAEAEEAFASAAAAAAAAGEPPPPRSGGADLAELLERAGAPLSHDKHAALKA